MDDINNSIKAMEMVLKSKKLEKHQRESLEDYIMDVKKKLR
jgi:hypothetical protein